jgi:hypothetical protein
MSLIVAGASISAGVPSRSFLTDPALRMTRPWNMRPRRTGERVTAIVIHAPVLSRAPKNPSPRIHERDPSVDEYAAIGVIADMKRGGRFAGIHLAIEADGSALCCADLRDEATYHVSGMNGCTVGILVARQRDGALFRAQIDAVPRVVAAVSDALSIPRRVAFPYLGKARQGIVSESGVWGFRDGAAEAQTWDPGDAVTRSLVDAGWEPF